jgi:ABC-type glycerol-3-phosphate transport system permease component
VATGRTHAAVGGSRHTGARVLGYAFLTIVSLFCVYPLFWVLITSLRTASSAFGKSFLPSASEWTANAYRSAFSVAHIGGGLANSLLVTGVTICLVLLVAVPGGYGFARFRFFGGRALFILLLSTLMVPAAAIIIPLFLEMKGFHLLDSLPGLILVYTATSVPFAVILMRGFFVRVPHELAEAAKIDGASDFGVFRLVMVPLVKPALLTLAVFQFLFSWNEFLLAETFLTTPGRLTLQPRIYSIVGQYSTNWPILCASLVVSVVPLIILYVLLQRRFVAGLTVGALKG